METNESASETKIPLRPLVGLTRGLPQSDLEAITANAIRIHRQLVDRADELFHGLPDACKTGRAPGGEQHIRYIEAAIEMHSQMAVVATLIALLGYTPSVSVN
ncbi:MAG: transcriptional repressor TraM [Xanthobacteraceae bacterium]